MGLGRAHDRGRPGRLGERSRCWRWRGQFSNNDRCFATTGNDLNNTTWAVDYSFKYKGFASIGEYADAQVGAGDRAPSSTTRACCCRRPTPSRRPACPGASFWELAFRYAQVDPSDLVDDNDRDEIGGALNYYYNRHNLKIQADYRQLKDDAANAGRGTTNKEFRLQTQFIF